jgi:glycosyltransferase involved in cell wall biosynthesis
MGAADGGISPTQWQRRVHPADYHERIRVIHDGIDTEYFAPDSTSVLDLPGGGRLTARDEVVTYVARGLEPYRGFHTFMRALPRLQALRPKAHAVIVGADRVSYGIPAPGGGSYRDWLLAQVGESIDLNRVHFLGWVPYPTLRSVYQVSSAHVYLTYPFILSWSMLEAMACACAVVGSATPPVTEVIVGGENGRLVDFFDSAKLANEIAAVLGAGSDTAPMRERARATVLERYDLTRICLPEHLRVLGV